MLAGLNTFARLQVTLLGFLPRPQVRAILAAKSWGWTITRPCTLGNSSTARFVTGGPQSPKTISAIHRFRDKPDKKSRSSINLTFSKVLHLILYLIYLNYLWKTKKISSNLFSFHPSVEFPKSILWIYNRCFICVIFITQG